MEKVLDIAVLVIALLAVIIGIVVFFKMEQEEKTTTPLSKPPVIPKSKPGPESKVLKTSQSATTLTERIKSTK